MTSLDSNISTADEFNFGPDGPPMDNVGPMELGITWAFMVPSFLAVALRFYCRGIMLRMIGYDDWFILPALAFAITHHVSIHVNVASGSGQHVWNITLQELMGVMKWSWFGNLMYAFALGFIKVSVLFQLLRITVRKSTYRKVIFGVFGVSIIFSVASVILAVLQCVPITYVWERMDPELGATGTCMEYFTSTVASSAMTVIMDMLIWITPMPLVYNLNLPHAQKVGLFFVFSIASVVCIASIGRLVVLAKTFSGPAQKDFSYNIKDAMIWSIAEIHVGVIAVSLPTLKPLLKKTMPSVFGYDSNSNSNGMNPSGYSSNGMKSGMGNSKNRSQLGKSIPIQVHSRKIDHPLDAAYSSSTEELQSLSSGEVKAVVSVV